MSRRKPYRETKVRVVCWACHGQGTIEKTIRVTAHPRPTCKKCGALIATGSPLRKTCDGCSPKFACDEVFLTLGLSARARTALKNNGIDTMEAVASAIRTGRLNGIRNFGKVSLLEVIEAFERVASGA